MPQYNAISDLISAPPRNRLMGLLADALTTANDYANKPDKTMPGGLANPPLSMLSGLLDLPSIATTAQRASYGEPLTNAGKANVPFLKPETANALMMAAPIGPKNALAAAAGLLGHAGPAEAASFVGLLGRNDLARDELKNLISSQRFIDRDIVAKKIREKKFDVSVTPEFMIDGSPVRAITDGHHALEAAIRSGNQPRFIVGTPSSNDRINLLREGNIDGFLESAYHDSPWYNFATKRDLF